MSASVFFAVLGAALLHAIWNALLKKAPDKSVAMVAVVLGHVPPALALLLVSPMPDPASLPFLAFSILLHVGYQIFLLNSYRIGELTQVYPIARGSAPLIVALVSVSLLGVSLGPAGIAGIVTIAAGILSLGLVRRSAARRNPKVAGLAFATGCFIAAYSLTDGLGTRAAGTALGFWSWLALGNALCMVLYARLVTPGALRHVPTLGRTAFLVGGSASFAAYAIVIWAFTQAPIALVTALRETSIVFALLIGVFALKERLDLAKVLSTMTIVLGAIILRFGRP